MAYNEEGKGDMGGFPELGFLSVILRIPRVDLWTHGFIKKIFIFFLHPLPWHGLVSADKVESRNGSQQTLGDPSARNSNG